MRANVDKIGKNITTNISLLCAARGKTRDDIMRIAGINSRNTFSSRHDKPGNWTLGQLVHIAAYFDITLEWLFSDHSSLEVKSDGN